MNYTHLNTRPSHISNLDTHSITLLALAYMMGFLSSLHFESIGDHNFDPLVN